jgi:hypothetical protein
VTEEVELMLVAVISKIPDAGAKVRLLAVPVAVPMEGKVELALALTSVDRPAIGKLTRPEFVTSYGGGAVPEAGNAGPIMIGIPEMLSIMLRPVPELEIDLTPALAGETPSAGTTPAARANAPIVAKADVLNAMTHPRWRE